MCKCVEHIFQFLEEFNEMWRKLLDEIIWDFQYQIKFVLDDKMKEPQQKMVCIMQFEIFNFNPHI